MKGLIFLILVLSSRHLVSSSVSNFANICTLDATDDLNCVLDYIIRDFNNITVVINSNCEYDAHNKMRYSLRMGILSNVYKILSISPTKYELQVLDFFQKYNYNPPTPLYNYIDTKIESLVSKKSNKYNYSSDYIDVYSDKSMNSNRLKYTGKMLYTCYTKGEIPEFPEYDNPTYLKYEIFNYELDGQNIADYDYSKDENLSKCNISNIIETILRENIITYFYYYKLVEFSSIVAKDYYNRTLQVYSNATHCTVSNSYVYNTNRVIKSFQVGDSQEPQYIVTEEPDEHLESLDRSTVTYNATYSKVMQTIPYSDLGGVSVWKIGHISYTFDEHRSSTSTKIIESGGFLHKCYKTSGLSDNLYNSEKYVLDKNSRILKSIDGYAIYPTWSRLLKSGNNTEVMYLLYWKLLETMDITYYYTREIWYSNVYALYNGRATLPVSSFKPKDNTSSYELYLESPKVYISSKGLTSFTRLEGYVEYYLSPRLYYCSKSGKHSNYKDAEKYEVSPCYNVSLNLPTSLQLRDENCSNYLRFRKLRIF